MLLHYLSILRMNSMCSLYYHNYLKYSFKTTSANIADPEQSDLGLKCWQFHLHFWEHSYSKVNLFSVFNYHSSLLNVPKKCNKSTDLYLKSLTITNILRYGN